MDVNTFATSYLSFTSSNSECRGYQETFKIFLIMLETARLRRDSPETFDASRIRFTSTLCSRWQCCRQQNCKTFYHSTHLERNQWSSSTNIKNLQSFPLFLSSNQFNTYRLCPQLRFILDSSLTFSLKKNRFHLYLVLEIIISATFASSVYSRHQNSIGYRYFYRISQIRLS